LSLKYSRVCIEESGSFRSDYLFAPGRFAPLNRYFIIIDEVFFDNFWLKQVMSLFTLGSARLVLVVALVYSFPDVFNVIMALISPYTNQPFIVPIRRTSIVSWDHPSQWRQGKWYNGGPKILWHFFYEKKDIRYQYINSFQINCFLSITLKFILSLVSRGLGGSSR
jgi:hypothetical protein